RDSLRIAVDHHRFTARLAHRHRCMHAAVVELDPLADAVRATPEDHNPRALRFTVAVLCPAALAARRALPARVEVRRARWELSCTRIDRHERALACERRL